MEIVRFLRTENEQRESRRQIRAHIRGALTYAAGKIRRTGEFWRGGYRLADGWKSLYEKKKDSAGQ